ncbi:hypothetical protein [Brachyspira pilosicoli]|uniref:hypothetical protein n=1 Tax=Brachyspira pilosicoli TaxID=52584 RepID=UPI0018F319F5|nr:hypothetical protein [Brachyspira pilosicoli]
MINNNKLDDIAIEILDILSNEALGEWSNPNSKYMRYRYLQIDKRGSFGERFFANVLYTIYNRRIVIEYKDGDQGEWDLKFNGFQFEIKTSSIDVNKKFQNEGIEKYGDYYGIMFLGVTPNDLYIKFVKKDDIPFDKLHNRAEKKTGKGYKWDFKLNDMIKISSLDDVKNEFENHFSDIFKKNKNIKKL